VRKESLDVEDKYLLLKQVEMESWSLGSVISVLPKLRKRIVAIKEKVKVHK
jgi:hypothetical protein